jgi:hypothetical protein
MIFHFIQTILSSHAVFKQFLHLLAMLAQHKTSEQFSKDLIKINSLEQTQNSQAKEQLQAARKRNSL